MIYHILALLIAAYSIVRGYRKGMGRQTPVLIGAGFGIICAHIFGVPFENWMRDLLTTYAARPEGDFIYSTLSRGLIYIAVYELFSFITAFLRPVLSRVGTGMLGSIFGSVFCLARYMLMLSVCYNLLLCFNLKSDLMRYAATDDGNIVEGVMLVSPALLGGESVEDLAHRLQLEDAKRIS